MKSTHDMTGDKGTPRVTLFWVKVLIALTLLMTAGLFAMSLYFSGY